jgi:hypothetical protein
MGVNNPPAAIIQGGSNNQGVFVPTVTAGYVKTDASGNISISSSTSSTAWNYTAQTTTYSASFNDFVSASGASFTITLPAVTSTSNGQLVGFQFNGTSITDVYTFNTSSSQSILYQGTTYTSGQIAAYTTGETFVFEAVWNGSTGSWVIAQHTCNTGWISDTTANVGASITTQYQFTATAISSNLGINATYTNNSHTFTAVSSFATSFTELVFTGTGAPSASGTLTKSTGTGPSTITFSAFTTQTTNPIATQGTQPSFNASPATNVSQWMRVGSNMIHWIQFYQATGGSAAGVGDYVWNTPGSAAINQSVAAVTGSPSFQAAGTPVVIVTSLYNATGCIVQSGTSYNFISLAVPFGANSYRVVSVTGEFIGPGSAIAPATGDIMYSWQATLPMSGWLP